MYLFLWTPFLGGDGPRLLLDDNDEDDDENDGDDGIGDGGRKGRADVQVSRYGRFDAGRSYPVVSGFQGAPVSPSWGVILRLLAFSGG